MNELTPKIEKLAQALQQAGHDHGMPNSFAPLELDSYGAGGAMSLGKIGKHNLPELNELLAKDGLTAAYANGRFFVSVAVARADNPRAPKRPPIGLVVRWRSEKLYRESRLQQIADAVGRYEAADKPVPADWVTERADLIEAGRVARIERAALHCPACSATEYCHAHAIELRPQYAPKDRQ